MSFVSLNIEYFPDPTRGVPVYNGYIYIGEPNTDPEIPGNQKTVALLTSDGTEVPTTQPLRTGAGGIVLYDNSHVHVLVEGSYSLKVLDHRGSQVYYVSSAKGITVPSTSLTLSTLKDIIGMGNGDLVISSGRDETGDQGGGRWVFNTSDLAAKVTIDPQSGAYAAPSSDPTGHSGAWVRQIDGDVNALWFGVVQSDTVDSTASIDAALDFVMASGHALAFHAGKYMHSGTVYTLEGYSVWYNSGFSSGVNVIASLEHNNILLTSETSHDTPLKPKEARVALSVTINAMGANHASGVRSNLVNRSTDGHGCTAFYGRATSVLETNWSAAVHGETRHGGGTSIALSSESACYSTKGSFYGLVLNQTTNGAEEFHPITGLPKEEHPSSTALYITGSAPVKGQWKRGVLIKNNALDPVKGVAFLNAAPAEVGIQFGNSAVNAVADILLEGDSNNGIVCNGEYTTGVAIRMRAGQAISMESSGNAKMYYETTGSNWHFNLGDQDRITLSLTGTGAGLDVYGTRVLGRRRTGWVPNTGTQSRLTFHTESVTLTELARHMKALLDDLTLHGLIGA